MPVANVSKHTNTLHRALHAIAVISLILAFGTIGFHYISGYPYIYAFFFTVMLATGEGPAQTPATSAGLLFSSFMALVGIGTVVVALLYLFGPAFLKFVRLSEEKIKKEEDVVKKRIRKDA